MINPIYLLSERQYQNIIHSFVAIIVDKLVDYQHQHYTNGHDDRYVQDYNAEKDICVRHQFRAAVNKLTPGKSLNNILLGRMYQDYLVHGVRRSVHDKDEVPENAITTRKMIPIEDGIAYNEIVISLPEELIDDIITTLNTDTYFAINILEGFITFGMEEYRLSYWLDPCWINDWLKRHNQ